MIENCPLCYAELQKMTYKSLVVDRKCTQFNRHFTIEYKKDQKIYCSLDINGLNWQWYFQAKTIYIQQIGYHPGKIMRSIPWFDPDFNDMDKLLNKLKLYTVLL